MQRLVGLVGFALCVVAAGSAGGCSASYQWVRAAEPSVHLAGSSIYVAQPHAGRYETRHYGESGRQTAAVLAEALRPHVARVSVGDAPQDSAQAIEAARGAGSTWLIYPSILHWEDRNTEWSGRPDRIEVRLDLIALDTGAIAHTATLTAESGTATFGGDHPQELLAEPIEEFVSTLL